jgi:hypothetical protein
MVMQEINSGEERRFVDKVKEERKFIDIELFGLPSQMGDLEVRKTELDVRKTELELLELKDKKNEQLKANVTKIAAFGAGALIFSGTLLTAFKPPFILTWLLIVFYVAVILALIFCGAVILFGGRRFEKLRLLLGAVSVYSIIVGLGSLTIFSVSNFISDWNETPKITNISVEKGVIEPNGVTKIEATIKDLNQNNIRYKWESDTGNFLDDEGSSAIWQAPAGNGVANVNLAILVNNQVVDEKIVKIAFQTPQNLEQKNTQLVTEFIKRCTSALDTAYNKALTKNPLSFQAATVICSSAASANDNSISVDDQYLSVAADRIAENIPVKELPKALVEFQESEKAKAEKENRRFSWWDKRPCCNQEFFLFPFCKYFSNECR